MNSSLTQYLDLFAEARPLLDANSCEPLNAQRDAARQQLEVHGLPTHKVERYKYCDVEAALAPNFGLNLRRIVAAENPYERYRCNVPNLSTLLYLVDGDVPVPLPEAKANVLPEGISICSLRTAATEKPELLQAYYHQASARTFDALTALNTLLVQDGLLVHIAKGAHVKNPVQIVSVVQGAAPIMANRRVLIVAEEGAEATVLFCDHAFGDVQTLTTQVTEVYAAAGSHLDLLSVEETNAAATRFVNVYAEMQADARVAYNGITLNCGQSRCQMDLRLLGAGATVVANGAVVADGQQRVDNNILVDHVSARCTSDLLFKYVLNESSVGAYAGKVLVRQDAQQTASEQTNANLCASPEAHAYSQPMLEIYADDVKCNHGSSIGKLDESALFYMQQRGIPLAEARLLLQHAFVNDVLQRIELEHLRDRLSHLVEMRFRGELSKCRDCSICH